jgi:broad specificity phosphatase PhoE
MFSHRYGSTRSRPNRNCGDYPPQELLLIRHAATDMTGRLCGQIDPPLNAIGRQQASALAVLLGGWNVQRLYASDLQRAVDTARPLAKSLNIPIVERSDLREISFGAWEGKLWSDIRRSGVDMRTIESSPDLYLPRGETFSCFRNRVLGALRETVAECNGQSAVIVTHVGVIRVVFNELSSANCLWDSQQRIDHCSVYRILLSGGVWEFAGRLD